MSGRIVMNLCCVVVATACGGEAATSPSPATQKRAVASTTSSGPTNPSAAASAVPSAASRATVDSGAPPSVAARLSAADCAKMTQRFVTLVLADPHVADSRGPAEVTTSQNADAWVRSRMPGLSDTEERCRREGNRTHYDCALAAKTMTSWQRCTVFFEDAPPP